MDLKRLSEDERPPPNPKGGIPPQRVPGWFRWPLRALFLPFVWLDLATQKVARMIVRPPFKSEGHCKKRGNCCFFILIKAYRGPLGLLMRFWATQINGFYFREKEPQMLNGKLWWVMGCRYLQKSGQCGHYSFRPAICRKWPLIEHFGYPQRIKGCGYKAVPRDPASPLKVFSD